MTRAPRDEPQVPSTRGPVWARPVGRFLAHVVWNAHVTGTEHVPTTGPVVLAANHVAALDGPLLVGTSPRPLHVLVKAEAFRGPLGALLRAAGQIPVDRDMARPALQAALGVLRRGGAVGIFPEGTRGAGTVTQARAGAAWLAVNAGATVVPVALLGARRLGDPPGSAVPPPRRDLHVQFGPPVDVTGHGGSRRAAIDRAAAAVRDALADLVVSAQERTGVLLPTDGPRPTV